MSNKTNIIFIMADDMGWGDLGCYGHQRIKTPNLDRMAAQGRLFTNYYCASSVCSPSRAGLLTGQFPGTNGIHDYLTPDHEINAAKGVQDFLDPAVATLPRVLNKNGYKTGHFGKWHLGHTSDAPSPFSYGYDQQKTTASNDHNWPDYAGDPKLRPYSTKMITDETITFINDCAHDNESFFINCWYQDPHAILNPPEELMTDYLQYTIPNIPYKSAPTIYYSVISDIDRNVGRIIDCIDSLNLANDTVIMFTSDNGPEEMEITNASHSAAGSPGPFRGRKRSLYDGGIRMPFIARWSGTIPESSIDDESVIGAIDMFPTFCEIAGVDAPADHALAGESILDILSGNERERSVPMIWEFAAHPMFGHTINKSPTIAIRQGQWKALFNPEGGRDELYDIPNDRSELHDVADEHPEIMEELKKQALAWKSSCPPLVRNPLAGNNTYPWPGE